LAGTKSESASTYGFIWHLPVTKLHFWRKNGIFALLQLRPQDQNIEKNLKQSDNFLDFSILKH
jgi:hypothetical protein